MLVTKWVDLGHSTPSLWQLCQQSVHVGAHSSSAQSGGIAQQQVWGRRAHNEQAELEFWWHSVIISLEVQSFTLYTAQPAAAHEQPLLVQHGAPHCHITVQQRPPEAPPPDCGPDVSTSPAGGRGRAGRTLAGGEADQPPSWRHAQPLPQSWLSTGDRTTAAFSLRQPARPSLGAPACTTCPLIAHPPPGWPSACRPAVLRWGAAPGCPSSTAR